MKRGTRELCAWGTWSLWVVDNGESEEGRGMRYLDLTGIGWRGDFTVRVGIVLNGLGIQPGWRFKWYSLPVEQHGYRGFMLGWDVFGVAVKLWRYGRRAL